MHPMFFAALFTMVKTWKQLKCPSADEWIKNTHMHNGMLLSHEKNETMPFSVTRMDLEIVTQSEVNQTKENIT